MQMIYRTGRVFRPIGEKTWWALKNTGKGLYTGIKWSVPYASKAITGTVTGIRDGYSWLSPKIAENVPIIFEKAKDLTSRGYAWAVPNIRYITPLALDTMARAGNSASSALLNAIGASPVPSVTGRGNGLSYFINLTVPGWERVASDIIDLAFKECLEYQGLVFVFRLPDGSIGRVPYALSSLKDAFAIVSGISAKYTEFSAYPISTREVLAPSEVQITLNKSGPESVEGYVKPLNYYRDVIVNLPLAADIVTESVQVRERERD